MDLPRKKTAAVILYCERPDCGKGYGSVGERPIICPACERSTTWTETAPQPDIPKFPYELTHNDVRFLHGLKIAAI